MRTEVCAAICLSALGVSALAPPAVMAQAVSTRSSGALSLASTVQAAGPLQTGARRTSLTELVQLALTRNAELLAVRQQISEAQGVLRQARLRPSPSIGVDLTTGRPFGSPGERDISMRYAHVFELGGKRGRRVDVADVGLEMARFEVVYRERELIAAVKARYAEALAARRNLQIAGQILDLADESLRLVGHRVRTGDAPPLDQGLLQVEAARLASARLMFESQAERAVLELKALAGIDPGVLLELEAVPREPIAESLSLQQAVARALEQRADLQAARREEQMRAADVRLARAEAVPDLIGSVGYAQGESRFDQFGLTAAGALTPLRDRDRLLTAGVTIALPFRNRNQGNIQAAQARADAARLRREFLEQTIPSEVRAALARYEAARRAADIFERQATGQSERNLELMRASYTLGETRLLDFIVEQRRLIDVQQAYTDVLREQAVARAELERAVGIATEALP